MFLAALDPGFVGCSRPTFAFPGVMDPYCTQLPLGTLPPSPSLCAVRVFEIKEKWGYWTDIPSPFEWLGGWTGGELVVVYTGLVGRKLGVRFVSQENWFDFFHQDKHHRQWLKLGPWGLWRTRAAPSSRCLGCGPALFKVISQHINTCAIWIHWVVLKEINLKPLLPSYNPM